jgi:hypothetical protein
MAEQKLTTWQVLRAKFPASEYVLIAEVSDASGFSRSRSLDYMLINLWQSRGLAVTGIEQKSNRGDWLKEMKNPAKQENHFKYCDYFYLLTDKEGVAKLEEIPPTWGWYHINDKQILKTMKAAPKLSSLPIERSLMCAMMRRAADKTGYVKREEIQSKIDEAKKDAAANLGYVKERNLKAYDDLVKKIADFTEASGIDLLNNYRWESGKRIGEAVRVIVNGGIDNLQNRLIDLKRSVEHIDENIEKHLKALDLCQKQPANKEL